MFRSQNVLKISVMVAFSVAALRFVWKRIKGGKDSQKSQPTAQPKQKAANGEAQTPETGIWIYFGSQSGTAEGFAKEIEQEATEHELQATVVDMEDFSPEDFAKHKAVVLVVATYGEGDPTDNAVDFFKWIQDDSLSSDLLQGMKFTVMGLGNRQYVNFNACARVADSRMSALGADCIYQRGEGDDDQNIEEDFEQWKGGGLWSALRGALGMGDAKADGEAQGLESAESAMSKLPLRGEVLGKGDKPAVDPLVQVGGADVLGKWYFNAVQAPVVVCKELRQVPDASTGKTTKHIELDVKSFPSLEWRTADNLEVLPSNPEADVLWFASRLGVEDRLEDKVSFKRAENVSRAVKKPFPSPCTVSTALSLYCDLCGTPNKAVAKRFAAFAESAEERQLLERLLQDREAYSLLEAGKVSLKDFFQLFLTSAKIDLGTFVQLCPRQKNRPYTISSSSKENSKQVGICVSMVQESAQSLQEVVKSLRDKGYAVECPADTNGSRCFKGVCSTMLCTRTEVGDKLWIAARPSSFRLPRRTSTPIVMVGAGTGLAPFRAFVREFRAESGTRETTKLFFGCTKQNEDFIYKDELQDALCSDPPALRELITAFSREQEKKIYVQDRLHERAKEMNELVGKGAYIYVCGAVNMGRAIRDELVSALGSSDHVTRLLAEGRYIEELW